MFIRLAVLLIGAVALTVVGFRAYTSLVRPWLRRRKLERLRDENERLDKIIHPDK